MEYKKFVPCRFCKGKSGPKEGFYYATKNNKPIIVECDCHKEWVRDNEHTRKMNEIDTSIEYDFSDYRGLKSVRSVNALKKIAEEPQYFTKGYLMYLYGKVDCQQTEMVKALEKELILKDYDVYAISMEELAPYLKRDFFTSDEERVKVEDKYKQIMNSDFLFLEDCFSSNTTYLNERGWKLPYFYKFFKERYEKKRTTFLLSNVLPHDIASVGFGVELQEFIESRTKSTFLKFEDSKNANIISATDDLFSEERYKD